MPRSISRTTTTGSLDLAARLLVVAVSGGVLLALVLAAYQHLFASNTGLFAPDVLIAASGRAILLVALVLVSSLTLVATKKFISSFAIRMFVVLLLVALLAVVSWNWTFSELLFGDLVRSDAPRVSRRIVPLLLVSLLFFEVMRREKPRTG